MIKKDNSILVFRFYHACNMYG